MNRATFTTKTGITSMMTIFATGIGMYTGALPIAAGAQTIITGLLALFLRDGIETATQATEDNTRKMQEQTIQLTNASLRTPPSMRWNPSNTTDTASEKGGA